MYRLVYFQFCKWSDKYFSQIKMLQIKLSCTGPPETWYFCWSAMIWSFCLRTCAQACVLFSADWYVTKRSSMCAFLGWLMCYQEHFDSYCFFFQFTMLSQVYASSCWTFRLLITFFLLVLSSSLSIVEHTKHYLVLIFVSNNLVCNISLQYCLTFLSYRQPEE
jgi:hypothetical protein